MARRPGRHEAYGERTMRGARSSACHPGPARPTVACGGRGAHRRNPHFGRTTGKNAPRTGTQPRRSPRNDGSSPDASRGRDRLSCRRSWIIKRRCEMKKPAMLALFASLLLAAAPQPVAAQSTLDAVKAKGYVQCGVNTGLAGFSQPDSKGEWRGIDVDLCRAVAAAVFGDATKVRYTPLTAQQRLTALQSGEVDVLSRNTTW